MRSTTHLFKHNARRALQNPILQRALHKTTRGFMARRQHAVKDLPEFAALRARAQQIKDHTLTHLDFYLQQFERNVLKQGGQVHWAATGQQACELITEICQAANARTVIKSKSMVGEEIALNEALAAGHFKVVETDLGEYIIQLAEEPPSHIIAPAIHKTRAQVADLFTKHHHAGLSVARDSVPELVNEARHTLRQAFLTAEVGITGANFLIAANGSVVLVTNEGNADLTNTLPRVHIVLASLEKVVPTLEDATTLLRLLGRSASGQAMSAYTTVISGARRTTDLEGPTEYHVVLVDNGRSQLLGGDFQDILRCIRCGACLNHCPVYGAVGGHAYGWVYPGPMGSVLTPLLQGLPSSVDLPNASTLCGRCEEVCPMQIPLPKLLRQLRVAGHQGQHHAWQTRWGLALWAFLARRPRLYQWVTAKKMRLLHYFGKRRGALRSVPFASGWTQSRDMPAPQGETFMTAWQRKR